METALAMAAALALSQCGGESAQTRKWFAMDTNLSVSLYGSPRTAGDSVFAALEAETARLEGIFTDFSDASALSEIKGSAGDTVSVDAEIMPVLEDALAMSRASVGAFDITLHDLKWLWGLAAGQVGTVPGQGSLDSLLAKNPTYRSAVDSSAYRPPLSILPGNRAVIHRADVTLDLGAIAKGHIVDRLHHLLDSLGAPDHIIQAGGEIRVGGRKRSGAWKIGIRHPRSADGLGGMLTFDRPVSVSTSGDYERYFEKDGVRYHHIFDPRTGRPASGFAAVSVVADSSEIADALSTTLFILGPIKGAAVARRFGAAAVWFRAESQGLCAIAMPELKLRLDLKDISACLDP